MIFVHDYIDQMCSTKKKLRNNGTLLDKQFRQNWSFAQNEAQIQRNTNASFLFLFPNYVHVQVIDDKS